MIDQKWGKTKKGSLNIPTVDVFKNLVERVSVQPRIQISVNIRSPVIQQITREIKNVLWDETAEV